MNTYVRGGIGNTRTWQYRKIDFMWQKNPIEFLEMKKIEPLI